MPQSSVSLADATAAPLPDLIDGFTISPLRLCDWGELERAASFAHMDDSNYAAKKAPNTAIQQRLVDRGLDRLRDGTFNVGSPALMSWCRAAQNWPHVLRASLLKKHPDMKADEASAIWEKQSPERQYDLQHKIYALNNIRPSPRLATAADDAMGPIQSLFSVAMTPKDRGGLGMSWAEVLGNSIDSLDNLIRLARGPQENPADQEALIADLAKQGDPVLDKLCADKNLSPQDLAALPAAEIESLVLAATNTPASAYTDKHRKNLAEVVKGYPARKAA